MNEARRPKPAARRQKRVRSPKPAARSLQERTGVVPEDILQLRYVGRPEISPDGRLIVFSCRHVGDKNEYVSDLWMANADGRSAPTAFTSGGRDTQPCFSPDGGRVAFVRAREKEKPQV